MAYLRMKYSHVSHASAKSYTIVKGIAQVLADVQGRKQDL